MHKSIACTNALLVMLTTATSCSDPCINRDDACISIKIADILNYSSASLNLYPGEMDGTLIASKIIDVSNPVEFRITNEAELRRTEVIKFTGINRNNNTTVTDCQALAWSADDHARVEITPRIAQPGPPLLSTHTPIASFSWPAKPSTSALLSLYTSNGILSAKPGFASAVLMKLPGQDSDAIAPVMEVKTSIEADHYIVSDISGDGQNDLISIDAQSGVVSASVRTGSLSFDPPFTVARVAGILPTGIGINQAGKARSDILLADYSPISNSRLVYIANDGGIPLFSMSSPSYISFDTNEQIVSIKRITAKNQGNEQTAIGILTKKSLYAFNTNEIPVLRRMSGLSINDGEELSFLLSRPIKRSSADDWDIAIAARSTITQSARIIIAKLNINENRIMPWQAIELKQPPLTLAAVRVNQDSVPDIVSLGQGGAAQLDLVAIDPVNRNPLVSTAETKPGYSIENIISLAEEDETNPSLSGLLVSMTDNRGFMAKTIWWSPALSVCYQR